MKLATHILGIIIISLTISSCAFHSGLMTGNAALNDANFKTVDYAIGSSETTKVFGFGSVATDGLMLEAKRNMYESYPLNPGQAYANVSVDFKTAYFLVVVKTKAIITADVVDFNENLVLDSVTPAFPAEIYDHSNALPDLANDVVFYEKENIFHSGEIVRFNKKRAKVLVNNQFNKLKVKRFKYGRLFFQHNKFKHIGDEFNIGDLINFYQVEGSGYTQVKIQQAGKLIAVGKKSVLIEYLELDKKILKKVNIENLLSESDLLKEKEQ